MASQPECCHHITKKQACMIIFVITRAHHYTHRRLRHFSGAPPYQMWSYERLLRSRHLPRVTWIFTDMDRLGFWELELSAHAYRELAAAGVRVLNDPAQVSQRYALLRRLHAAGINRFTVWPAAEPERPERFPVFLRTISAHRGVLTELLETPAALEQAIDEAVANGYPLADLMIVEYCAQLIGEGLYAKFAAFRCGDRIVETIAAHQRHWCAKYGEKGVATDEIYNGEYARIRDNPNAEVLMQAFEVANIEYGRADYTVIDGKIQIYEINTNPMLGRHTSHPFPRRLESDRLWQENFVSALKAIDTTNKGKSVKLIDKVLRKYRRKQRFTFGTKWTP
jgi:hypothetical protein